MLYYLFNYLDQLDFPGAGMFKYVSFRSALALILSSVSYTHLTLPTKRIV